MGGSVNVALDIHGEAGGLWDGETEVERHTSWDSAETDEETPHEVDSVQFSWGVF